MKRLVSFLSLLTVLAAPAWAVYLENVPTTLTQPDGRTVAALIDGDEFFHRVHDPAGYTIIKNEASGWYVYAMRQGDDLAPTSLVAGRDDPSRLGLEKGLLPAPSKLRDLRKARPYMSNNGAKAPPTGTINNLVVYVRFKDQTEFDSAAVYYDTTFNNTTPNRNSLRNYFQEASYGSLTVSTTFYPIPGTFVVSFQDTFNRSYYCPYNATTAPDGYTGDPINSPEITVREHRLLKSAINAIAAVVPSGLNIDSDNNGYVDNVCFVIRGPTTAWATLLWSHRWALYSQTAYINSKRVWDYNFQMETQFGVHVLSHEMGHSVGYPDLYHYYHGTSLSATGLWDVMCSTPNPPTHTGAYMKSQYTGWLGAIPEITASGTYWLKPLASGTIGVSYKIASPNSSSEYFVVEYRRKTGTFENSIYGSGLLVYRINSDFTGQGNAFYAPADTPAIYDEVYIYRPGGSPTVNGTLSTAYLSSGAGRMEINDGSDPAPFLHDGSDGGLDISSVGAAGDSISFYVTMPVGVASAPVTASPISKLKLLPARPNPSRGAARLSFELDKSGPARLAVYSVTGQLVAGLLDGSLPAGRHEVQWNGHDRSGKQVASGVYYVRLENNGQRLTQRLTVLR
jgi:M6 family metalloprotease-like protein